jgi:hypothetical protein
MVAGTVMCFERAKARLEIIHQAVGTSFEKPSKGDIGLDNLLALVGIEVHIERSFYK